MQQREKNYYLEVIEYFVGEEDLSKHGLKFKNEIRTFNITNKTIMNRVK